MRRPLPWAVLVALALAVAGAYAIVTEPQRRLDRWSEELEVRLETERTRHEARRVAREPRIEAELHATIDGVLSLVPTPTPGERRTWFNEYYALAPESVWSSGYKRSGPGLVTPELERAGARYRPFVAPLRATLRCTRVARAFDAEAARKPWKQWHADTSLVASAFNAVTAGFALEGVQDLEAGRPAEASRLLVDHWQLQHELAQRGGLHEQAVSSKGPFCMGLAMAIVPRLGEAELDAFDRELEALDQGEPSLARAAEHDRLVLDVALRDGGFTEALDAGFRRVETGKLDVFATSLGKRRLAFIDRVDRLYGEVIEAVSLPEPWRVRAAVQDLLAHDQGLWGKTRNELSSPGEWNGSGPEDFEALATIVDDQLLDRAELRLARLLVAARRFAQARGRWPTSHAEALGREPTSKERDPFRGEPFVLEQAPGGALLAGTKDAVRLERRAVFTLPPLDASHR